MLVTDSFRGKVLDSVKYLGFLARQKTHADVINKFRDLSVP